MEVEEHRLLTIYRRGGEQNQNNEIQRVSSIIATNIVNVLDIGGGGEIEIEENEEYDEYYVEEKMFQSRMNENEHLLETIKETISRLAGEKVEEKVEQSRSQRQTILSSLHSHSLESREGDSVIRRISSEKLEDEIVRVQE